MKTETLLSLMVFLPAATFGQSSSVTLPQGTQLPVSTTQRLPMRAGTPIHAQLLYPVYANNGVVLPAHTRIDGTVVSLNPDHSRRLNARLRADFTPFHTPVVRFDSIVTPNGVAIPISTIEATNGAPIYRVIPQPTPKGGFVGQYFHIAVGYLRDSINAIVGPGKAERFQQFIYSQLPYHPEYIARDTAWTLETATPLQLAAVAPPVVPPPPPPPNNFVSRFLHPSPEPMPSEKVEPSSWRIEAYLDEAISSKTSQNAQVIRATVAQPVFNADGTIAVPQGASLIGTVTQAKPARKFARAGVLHFSFSELKLADQPTIRVRTTLKGADSSSASELAMDSEGQVKPKAQDKILLPALLVIMASQPFDHEHHGEGGHMVGKDAVASSGLGLISLIVGTAAQQPNLAIGIGYYSAALAIYPRYFGRGEEVAFPKDTRIVVQTTARPTRTLEADQP